MKTRFLTRLGVALVCVVAFCPFLVGCTSPTQPIAQHAFERGESYDHQVFENMAKLSKQHLLNGSIDYMKAVAGDDKKVSDTLVTAAEKMFNEHEKIAWLEKMHERARALKRLSYGYIVEQQGILNILEKDWNEAKARQAAIELMQSEGASSLFGLDNPANVFNK